MDLTLLAFAYSKEQEQEQEQEQTKAYNRCYNCGGSDFIEIDYERICVDCQAIDPRYKALATVNNNLIDYTKRHVYSRSKYFLTCIQWYQGKQLRAIPDKIYDDLKARPNVTRESILQYLKEQKQARYYKDVHMIFYGLTGKRIDDIEYLEYTLIHDYREFIKAYGELQLDRKNSLNVQYVLYQLLQRHGHPCNAENFSLPKTEKCKAFHDEVCRKIFESLGWRFFPKE